MVTPERKQGWPVPCFVCGKQLAPAIPPEVRIRKDANQPYAGTAFTSHGHYGSTVFDPMGPGTILELNICDDCLRAGAERVLHGAVHTHETISYLPWNPPAPFEEDEEG